jgi:hypothetical protein
VLRRQMPRCRWRADGDNPGQQQDRTTRRQSISPAQLGVTAVLYGAATRSMASGASSEVKPRGARTLAEHGAQFNPGRRCHCGGRWDQKTITLYGRTAALQGRSKPGTHYARHWHTVESSDRPYLESS